MKSQGERENEYKKIRQLQTCLFLTKDPHSSLDLCKKKLLEKWGEKNNSKEITKDKNTTFNSEIDSLIKKCELLKFSILYKQNYPIVKKTYKERLVFFCRNSADLADEVVTSAKKTRSYT